MASEYYGLNNSVTDMGPDAVAIGTSTTSKDIEVRIDLTKSWTSVQINQALDAIFRKIIDGTLNTIGSV